MTLGVDLNHITEMRVFVKIGIDVMNLRKCEMSEGNNFIGDKIVTINNQEVVGSIPLEITF